MSSSVTSVTASNLSDANGKVLNEGDVVAFTLTVDAPVQVTAAVDGSMPALVLSNGALASYVGTSADSTALTFSYTVAAGDDMANLQVTGLSFNNASIASVGSTAFQPRVAYAVGSAPFVIATADLNGDAAPDVLAGDAEGGTVSVLLNDGQGNFGARTPYFVGNGGPYALTTTDLNGDGSPDLIAADYNGAVSVLLGNGAGDFGPLVSYPAGGGPLGLTAADLNGDGKQDLIVVNQKSSTVSVLLGDGQGSLGAPISYFDGPGSRSERLAVGDVNGDGKLDVAVANNASDLVSVLLGDGQGGFGAPTSYATGAGPYDIVAGDFNTDGKLDLAVVNELDNTVSVLLNDGQGGFGARINYAVGSSVFSLATADVNGDAALDLITSGFNAETATVLLGDGQGAFGSQTSFAAGPGLTLSAVADLNGDGRPDLVVPNYYSSTGPGNTVSVLLNSSIAAQPLDVSGIAGLPGSGTGFVVDTTSPLISAALTRDTGASATDRVTSDPTLAGLGEPGATVILTRGGAVLGTVTADATGAWRFTPALADGPHTVVVSETDAAGNTGTATLSLELDTSGPAALARPLLALANDSGAVGDGVTNVSKPVITGSGVAGDTVTLFDGTTLVGLATVAGDGTWSVALAAALADGVHTLTTTQTDAAGNVSAASAALPLTIDTVLPPAPSALALALASDSGVVGDGITGDATPTLAGTAEAGSTVALFDGASLLGTVLADGDGRWGFTPATALAEGGHSITAAATDAAGNVSAASVALALTVDTVLPSAPSALALALGSDSGVVGDGVTDVSKPVITGNGVAGDTVTLLDGTTPVGFATVAGDGTWLVAPAAALADGVHTLTTTQTDAAGNVSAASAALVLTIDPSVSVPVPTVGGQIPNGNTPTLSGRATPGSTVTLLANGVAIGSALADAATGTFEVTPDAPLALGLNSLTTTQTTASGTSVPSAPVVLFVVQAPEAGISTTGFSSADIGGALDLGASLAFIGGTEAVLLTDATLSVGPNTNQATLQRLYQGLLGHGNDTRGITYWDDQLSHGVSKAVVAAGFLTSDEYLAAHPAQTDEQFVTSLYQGLLGRPPEQDGLAAWANALAQGASRAEVVVSVADSGEAKSHLAPTTARVYVPNNAGTLTHVLYETGLGREVELPALTYWKAAYDALTPLQLAALIASSPEFTAYHAGQSNDAYVNSLYQAGLGRPAEASGLASWTSLLSSGEATRADVLLAIATSDEARAHLTYNFSGVSIS